MNRGETWWKACLYIRSFHSSMLQKRSSSPSAERFQIPLFECCWTQWSIRQEWATEMVCWAESGWFMLWEIRKRPSFGCLSSPISFALAFFPLCWPSVLIDFNDRWKAARLATNRTNTQIVQTFASGLRSECSNHSWLTLAGSSCNWLQQRIRNLTTHFISVRRLLAFVVCRRVRSGLVLEFAVMIGWHWPSLSSLCSAFAQNVTRFRLLFVCRVIFCILLMLFTNIFV